MVDLKEAEPIEAAVTAARQALQLTQELLKRSASGKPRHARERLGRVAAPCCGR
ncbi:MAG: hypothetical protein WKF75_00040 [Singulisphaera sp.]